MRNKICTATFGAGCFWDVQKAFSEINGVIETFAGYTGGHEPDPSYKDVSAGSTGHTEVVQVKYNPDEVTYGELLDKFWEIHDPAEEEKKQYRSVIFYYNEEQRAEAVQSRMAKEKELEKDIVTDIVPALEFYKAEAKHQHYLDKEKKK